MTTGKPCSSILHIPVSSTTSFSFLTSTPLKSSTTITYSRENAPLLPIRDPIVPHYPSRPSSPCYSPSRHFTGRYITPERFANTTHQQDHLAQAVALLKGDPVSFAEFIFIDYLCRDLWKMRQNLIDQEQVARQRLLQFFE